MRYGPGLIIDATIPAPHNMGKAAGTVKRKENRENVESAIVAEDHQFAPTIAKPIRSPIADAEIGRGKRFRRTCGPPNAGEDLPKAALVDSFDPEGMADASQQALTMPVEERMERHNAMLRTLLRNDITYWRQSFVDALTRAPNQ